MKEPPTRTREASAKKSTTIAAALPAEERFLDCVHCGLCLAACPTYLDTGLEADSPRGRIYLMKGIRDERLPLTDDAVRHLDLCLACRACETACPSGVQYGALIESARPAIETHHRRAWPTRLRRAAIARIVADPRGQRWFIRAARLIPRRLLRRLAGIAALPDALRHHAALAAVVPAPERAPLPRLVEPRHAAGDSTKTVALFPGCVAQGFFADTNRRAARLLAHAGFRVRVPAEPVCCGALLLHLGHRDHALRVARRTASLLRALDADIIATTAAGCGAMLQSYGELLGDADADADGHLIAGRVRDVTAVLADGDLPAPPHAINRRVTYHDACHLAHGQGVWTAPRSLLRRIPGIDLVELPESDSCCGSAGTYNLTEPAMARRLAERKVDCILTTGASIVATGNPGCVLQIRAALAVRGAAVEVAHAADLLAAAHLGTT
jgi:glycolate oxidase iron-sulfur subunit